MTIGLLLLTACSESEKQENLEEYIAKIKTRTSSEIEPLPQIKPHQPLTYKAQSLRSPFTPSKLDSVTLPKDTSGVHPDTNRPKEALEKFPLDTLKMVGTLEKNGKIWALIMDGDGQIYRVSQGNYIGLNHGKIKIITDKKIYISEMIPDAGGSWKEYPIEMTLAAPE